MKVSIAMLGGGQAISYKGKQKLTKQLSNYAPKYLPVQTENRFTPKPVHV